MERFKSTAKLLLLTTLTACTLLLWSSQAQAWKATVYNKSEHRVKAVLWCVKVLSAYKTDNVQSAKIDPGGSVVLNCRGATCLSDFQLYHEMNGCPAYHNEYLRFDPNYRISDLEWACGLFACCFNKKFEYR